MVDCHISPLDICHGFSLKPSDGDGSYEESHHILSLGKYRNLSSNKALQAIQSPRTVPFFLLVSLLDGYSFPNVLVKGIVAFKH